MPGLHLQEARPWPGAASRPMARGAEEDDIGEACLRPPSQAR